MQRGLIAFIVFALLLGIFDLYVNDARITVSMYRQAQQMGRQLDVYADQIMYFIGRS